MQSVATSRRFRGRLQPRPGEAADCASHHCRARAALGVDEFTGGVEHAQDAAVSLRKEADEADGCFLVGGRIDQRLLEAAAAEMQILATLP